MKQGGGVDSTQAEISHFSYFETKQGNGALLPPKKSSFTVEPPRKVSSPQSLSVYRSKQFHHIILQYFFIERYTVNLWFQSLYVPFRIFISELQILKEKYFLSRVCLFIFICIINKLGECFILKFHRKLNTLSMVHEIFRFLERHFLGVLITRSIRPPYT